MQSVRVFSIRLIISNISQVFYFLMYYFLSFCSDRADRKPKLDLLKTCVACIPRLLPIDMTKQEILEILAKVCLHVDEDVRKMAQQAMANLIVELPAYRVKTIQG